MLCTGLTVNLNVYILSPELSYTVAVVTLAWYHKLQIETRSIVVTRCWHARPLTRQGTLGVRYIDRVLHAPGCGSTINILCLWPWSVSFTGKQVAFVYAPANDIWQMVLLVHSSFILFVDLSTHGLYVSGTNYNYLTCKYVWQFVLIWWWAFIFHIIE